MENKPDWKDAPKWANFVAMDKSGHWYWYEKEPYMGLSENVWFSKGNEQLANIVPAKFENLRDTLEKRP